MGRVSLLMLVLAAAGCTNMPANDTKDLTYSPPEASGLVGVRAYPGANDVCQVIGENDVTVEYLDHTQLLIGCPSNEQGAISDRQAEGAQILETVGAWTLLTVPHEGP